MTRQLWVIKAGSQIVCAGGASLIHSWMRQVFDLKRQFGVDVVWVTSGAIATAAGKFTLLKDEKSLPEKQALSAIGQPLVMDQYNRALSDIGLMGAQVLLTAADTRLSKSRKNLINTLSKLIAWQAVPILNENDAVATEEIKFGDNDRLSALIAGLVGAQKLILLTNVDGLYSADPESNPAAELVHYKNDVTERDLRAVRAAGKSRMGTGGMYSKLLAARLARKRKIVTHLLRGDQPEVLVRLAQGEKIGTQIGGRP